MNGGSLSDLYFQTFYVSKEKSNCPLIADALRIGKRIKEKGISDIIISQRYGKRILINTLGEDEEESRDNFLEIVDYDPIKKIVLAMGVKKPRIETSLHWFIHHARDEINAVVQINDQDAAKKFKNLTETKNECVIGTIEQIKEVMKGLRNNNKIIIKNQGTIFVGRSIKEVEKQIMESIKLR